MGNCQAVEVAAEVVVQHPENGKVERMYWAISANEVMSSNPGHYVALVVETSSSDPNVTASNAPPPHGGVKHQLKLLRPTDILHVGHVYRLITFEDVIKEFASKKSVKLGKLVKDNGVLSVDQTQREQNGRVSRHLGGGEQWKPDLQSIAEFGS